MHIHLDLVGGLAGDMFVGAMLDCFPDLAESLSDELKKAGFRDLVALEISPVDDGTLTGTGFHVSPAGDAEGHQHRHYSEIRGIIENSELAPAVKDHALGIFRVLAEAEAAVHGKPVEDVAFHEVGAWDSIADIVSAASLIVAVGAASFSVSKLPLGSGHVKTAHGMLPVPAPATALILNGFEFFDDGIAGERITPTGAAIIKHLIPSPDTAQATPQGKLTRTGYGFGRKRFAGISNVTRALVFDQIETEWDHDQVAVLEFEIDDQTPEEISISAEKLRETPGVLDLSLQARTGKKSRDMMSFRILVQPDHETEVTRACFMETTTLGIRRQLVTRAVLSRETRTVARDDGAFRVKVAARPGGATAKLEADDMARLSGGHAERSEARRKIETDIDHDD